MLLQQSKPIKNWMETMGFELVKSDFFNDNLFNYYHLGNFGVCEEIQTLEKTIYKVVTQLSNESVKE